MANKFPLQAGDRTPDLSDSFINGPEADRREQDAPPVSAPMEQNAARSLEAPVTPLWRDGQLAPVRHMAPFDGVCVHTEGDTSGDGTTTHDVDIYSYGDCYDPTAPTRVRTKDWVVDTDFDGSPN